MRHEADFTGSSPAGMVGLIERALAALREVSTPGDACGPSRKIAAFTLYFMEDEGGPVRAAFLPIDHVEAEVGVSYFIVRVTMREVKRLQCNTIKAEYGHGHEGFIPAQALHQGRTPRSE